MYGAACMFPFSQERAYFSTSFLGTIPENCFKRGRFNQEISRKSTKKGSFGGEIWKRGLKSNFPIRGSNRNRETHTGSTLIS
jgi:hypothetical protein